MELPIVIEPTPTGRFWAHVGEPFPADDAYKTDWVYWELQEAVAEDRRLEESPGL